MGAHLRTIILLSAKRTGSTAVFRMFQRHPDVSVCHVDQEIDLWEPNFWNLAAKAIEGKPQPFIDRLGESHPYLEIKTPVEENQVFDLWDEILDRLGPRIFDKSPQYLSDCAGIELLKRYSERGNDVRVFSIIRDPRDAICSQFAQWGKLVKDDSPERREREWLKHYAFLEKIQRSGDLGFIPLLRYEDLVSAPDCYVPVICQHVGVDYDPRIHSHLQPLNVGRHRWAGQRALRRWKPSEKLQEHMVKYGYLDADRRLKSRARNLARKVAQRLGKS
jgi:hypothetical protein